MKERIAYTRECAANHCPVIKGVDPSISFVIDSNVAKRILEEHELKSYDSDEDPAGDCQYANLHKPSKPRKLLDCALTNVNGDVWKRQRYCISRAFAVPKKIREKWSFFAAEKFLDILSKDQLSNSHINVGKKKLLSVCSMKCKKKGVDIRKVSKEVAVCTLLVAVLGEECGRRKDLIDGFGLMFLDNLEPRRDEESSLETKQIFTHIDTLIRCFIDNVASTPDQLEDDCLLQRLLRFEIENPSDDDNYLTRDEIVSNVFSALLAGSQTICTTITGVFCFLASRNDLQLDLRMGKLTPKDVVQETLRIFPPVAGLPRFAADCEFELAKDDIRTEFEKSLVFIIDLLAFAHSECNESLEFRPEETKDSQAQPWGIGKRKCPAGIISLECISEVLSSISDEYTWTFLNEKTHLKDRYGNGEWIEDIQYRPTLQFPRELRLQFSRHDEECRSIRKYEEF